MAISRNATEYLERKGLLQLTLPAPRLHITALKANQLALAKPYPGQHTLIGLEGLEPVDRGVAKPWPNQVDDYGTT